MIVSRVVTIRLSRHGADDRPIVHTVGAGVGGAGVAARCGGARWWREGRQDLTSRRCRPGRLARGCPEGDAEALPELLGHRDNALLLLPGVLLSRAAGSPPWATFWVGRASQTPGGSAQDRSPGTERRTRSDCCSMDKAIANSAPTQPCPQSAADSPGRHPHASCLQWGRAHTAVGASDRGRFAARKITVVNDLKEVHKTSACVQYQRTPNDTYKC